MTIPDHMITPLDWSAEALRHAAAWTSQPEGARALVESKRYLAMHEQIERLRAEWQASERRAIEYGDIVAQYVAVMRAAVLDGDTGMRWIINTLAGPGHLPDGLGEHADAQAMFDAEVAEIEAHRAKHPIPEPVVGPLRAQIRTLTAERDAALAEVDRITEAGRAHIRRAAAFEAQRDELKAELAARLAEIERAEPVAWRYPYRFRDIGETGACEIVAHDVAVIMRLPKGEPLYARPAQAAAPELAEPGTKAARDVLAERRRQVEVEGWTPGHDDEHSNGCIGIAAACYALADVGSRVVNAGWLWRWTGWDDSLFKPYDRRSNLVRAAAMLLAEIERLDRTSAPEQKAAGCGACGDACRSRGSCRPADESPKPAARPCRCGPDGCSESTSCPRGER